MAGGTWNKLSLKERPGTYINFQSDKVGVVSIAERGTAIMPLLGHNYGPAGEFITIESSSPDAQYAKLGYSVYEEPLLLVREMFKSAKTVILYIPAQGEKAEASVSLAAEASETAKAVNEAISTYLGAKSDLTGCTLDFNEQARQLTVALEGSVADVKNTGIIDTLTALVSEGYTVTVDGTTVTSAADLKGTDSYAKLAALAEGDSLAIPVTVSKDGESEEYSVNVGYNSTATAQAVSSANTEGSTITAKAMYGGERGNALSFDCTPNEDDDEAFDVNVYLDNSAVETFEGLKTVGDLIAAGSQWITFKGDVEAALTDFSAISLEGGTNGAVNTVDMTKFLDASEAVHWNTMAFPVDSAENSSLLTAAVSKIKYLRDDVGKYRKLVVANYAPDYEGVINVCNGYVLSDGTVVDAVKATAWVAGADAGADCVTSNTYKAVEDAADIDGLLSHTEAVAAIKAGKFFFSFNESNEVVVEYDINSLTTYGDGKKGKNWRKNRVLRVMDSFGESVQLNFPPNKFDNDPDGWNIMEGLGKSILKLYGQKSDGGVGALKNIDYDNDFLVDRELSEDDETFYNCYIQPVDSSEKLYFTVTTH